MNWYLWRRTVKEVTSTEGLIGDDLRRLRATAFWQLVRNPHQIALGKGMDGANLLLKDAVALLFRNLQIDFEIPTTGA